MEQEELTCYGLYLVAMTERARLLSLRIDQPYCINLRARALQEMAGKGGSDDRLAGLHRRMLQLHRELIGFRGDSFANLKLFNKELIL